MSIEALLTRFIAPMGGVHLRSIVGDSPDFRNADFLFQDDGVLAELKCLDEDLIGDPAFMKKATELYLGCSVAQRGRSLPVGPGTLYVTTAGASEDVVRKVVELYYKPFKRCVETANKQIKVAAKQLGLDSPAGLLIIANNNHSGLDPEHALQLLELVFRRQTYSSINAVFYASAGQRVGLAESADDIDVSIVYRNPNASPLDQGFLHRFSLAWLDVLKVLRKREPEARIQIDRRMLPALVNRS